MIDDLLIAIVAMVAGCYAIAAAAIVTLMGVGWMYRKGGDLMHWLRT